LTKLKLLEFMSDKIGDEFDAVITGVERFGLFCQGLQMPVDGFVHISALSDGDYFNFDPDSLSLIGRASGTQFRLGDRVRVQVAAVDEQRRELDFRIVVGKSSRRLPRGESPPARRDPPEDRPRNKTSRRGGARPGRRR
jgi:ribonuclease R